jgi:hypothetical protein
MHTLALILAAISVAINGIAFAMSGLLNEPKAGGCFGGAAALSLVALVLGYNDVAVLAWVLMAATLAAIAALGVYVISAHEGQAEQVRDADAPAGPPKLNEAWGHLAFSVPAVVPAAASLAALLN